MMQDVATDRLPLACVPGAIPAEERPAHFALLERLFGAGVLARDGLADGYEFRFDAARLDDLARFVGNERKCCPFLSFALTLPAGDDAVRLRMTGPKGTRAFLEAELSIQTPETE